MAVLASPTFEVFKALVEQLPKSVYLPDDKNECIITPIENMDEFVGSIHKHIDSCRSTEKDKSKLWSDNHPDEPDNRHYIALRGNEYYLIDQYNIGKLLKSLKLPLWRVLIYIPD